jgi:hypothetical protein
MRHVHMYAGKVKSDMEKEIKIGQEMNR